MKKILALILSLAAVFTALTACATVDGTSTGGSGNSESVLPGDSTGGGGTVVPPITDGGNFDGGGY